VSFDIEHRQRLSRQAAKLIEADLETLRCVLLSPKEPLAVKNREQIELRLHGLQERLLMSFETVLQPLLDTPPKQ
jgi:hypothetical protein